jgi:hypothetical protein
VKDIDKLRLDLDRLNRILSECDITFKLYNKDGSESKLKVSWSSFSIGQKTEPTLQANPNYKNYYDLEFKLKKEKG